MKQETNKTAGPEAGGTSGQSVHRSKFRQKSQQEQTAASKLRMEKRGEKLEKAKEKLAKQKPPKPPGPVRRVAGTVGSGVHGYVHGKMFEVEQDNMGTEGAHRSELVGESALHHGKRFVQKKIREHPAKAVRKAESRHIKARLDYHYRMATQEHPEMRGNALSRLIQKQKIKRQYVKQAREAPKQGAKAAEKTAVTTEKLAARAVGFVKRHPVGALLFVAAFLLLVMMLLNHRMVGGGLGNLARFRADADSAVSAASLFALLHTLLLFFHTDAVSRGEAPLFASAAGLGLLLGAVGRQMRLGRIAENFRFVSYQGDKYAAHRVEDPQSAVEIGRSAVALGEPEVAYFKKADFLERFLENSYGDDGSDRAMRIFVPLALLASLLLGAGCLLLKKADWWGALAVGVGTFCLASPVAALTASNFPLLRAAKRCLRRGSMLIGWEAVREFGSLHAVAVDAQDLFPSESVLLHGIKTFSGARIDEALLEAAAVSIAAGGPLAGVFRRVIENKTDMLPPVDTLVYEQDMGLSGWVGGRRVLVGNRRLLENHGVDVPSRDYENRYAKDGRQLVYLSTAGELSAMFVVSYIADEGIAQSLHSMEKAGLTLLVRTCDPNVTESLICGTFDMDSYYVEVMGVTAGRAYERLRSAPQTGNPDAVLASNGRLEGMATALTACRRLRGGVALAVTAQIVGAALGFGLNVFLALTTGLSLPPLYMLGYLLGWSAVSWILPLIRKV